MEQSDTEGIRLQLHNIRVSVPSQNPLTGDESRPATSIKLTPATLEPPYRVAGREEFNTQRKKGKGRPGEKYRWHDPNSDDQITAGGILFYDDTGFWAVGEIDDATNNTITYTDPGGRYTPEDGTIWTAIRRELYEETYGVCDFLVKDIIEWSKKYGVIKVDGHLKKPVYVCLCVPVSAVPDLKFDTELFITNRNKLLLQNPYAPTHIHFKPVVLQKISYAEAETHKYKLSYRLKSILSNF